MKAVFAELMHARSDNAGRSLDCAVYESDAASGTPLWLGLILLAAAVLRFAALDTSPPSLFRDEVEKGYNAFALLHGGVAISVVPAGPYYSLERRTLPLFLNVYNSHTSMIYQYAAAPFVAVLGLNAWGTRVPAAAAGVLTVLFTFLLGRELAGRCAGLYAAAFLAVSPWHVMFSRWAQQGIMVPLFLTLGLWGFFRFVNGVAPPGSRLSDGLGDGERRGTGEDASPRCASPLQPAGAPGRADRSGGAGAVFPGAWLPLSAGAFALAFYAYDAGRVFVILFLPLLLVLFWRPLRAGWKWTLGAAAVFVLLSAPTVAFLFTPESRARYEAVSAGASAFTFVRNWLAHFSPSFLFLHGDANLRHSYPGFGQLHVFEAVLWLAAVPVLRRLPRRLGLVLLGWLSLAPVPAALTTEGVPHALRSIAMLPLPALISGLGACGVHRLVQRRRAVVQSEGRRPNAGFQRVVLLLALLALGGWTGLFARMVWWTYPELSEMQWGYAEGRIFEPDVLGRPVGAPVLISPNFLYAPYFSMFARRFVPDEGGRNQGRVGGAPYRDASGALFPTPAWNPARDAPGDVYYWVGTAFDGLRGEPMLEIPWTTELARAQSGGAPAVVVVRVRAP
ncbi:MAG: hypothetical protein Kow0059_19800 [Candidatus Sumerlaeia bacterium]